MKIDLSKFHKIECDDHCTVLEHPNGHQIKIAHKGLSSNYKKELESLPLKMAKGGMASRPSKSSNTMPGSPTEAKKAYSEPKDIGTLGSVSISDAEAHGIKGMSESGEYLPCINPACKSYGRAHPNCKCYGQMAEGGEVKSFCSKHNPHQKGCMYFADGGTIDNELKQELNTLADESQVADAENQMASNEDLGIDKEIADAEVAGKVDQPAVPAAQPVAAPKPAMAKEPVTETPEQSVVEQGLNHAQEVNKQLLREDAAIQADINSGHIQPKSYQDLFGEKNTIGKIGTLFGLLVGGAGSGLAGQPNKIMEMMDNQIKNDLLAQQNSAANKQNLLRINQEAISAMAGANMTQQQAESLALANTYMQANRLALDSLSKSIQKLPPGSPQRMQAEQSLAIMSQMVDVKNASIASQAAMAAALTNQMNGGAGPNTMMMKSGLMGPKIQNLGQDIEDKTIPGIPGRATRPVPQSTRDEIGAMKVLSDKAQDLIDFSKKHVGTLSPQQRAVAQQKAEEMINFYNSSIKGGVLTEGRLAWLDSQIKKNPTGIVTQLMGNNARLQEIKNSNDHRMDILLDQYGFPKQRGKVPTSSAKSGKEEFKTVNGIKYKRGKNGEAIKVD